MLPLLSSKLSAPFAVACPPLLLSTLYTLQSIILIAWPRIPQYRAEILKGLTVCWFRIDDELEEQDQKGEAMNEELKRIRQSIRATIQILTATTLEQDALDVVGEYRMLVAEGDERLRGLLVA